MLIMLSDRLSSWRDAKGLTQWQLAQLADIPRPNLSAIERGKRYADERYAAAMQDARAAGAGSMQSASVDSAKQ